MVEPPEKAGSSKLLGGAADDGSGTVVGRREVGKAEGGGGGVGEEGRGKADDFLSFLRSVFLPPSNHPFLSSAYPYLSRLAFLSRTLSPFLYLSLASLAAVLGHRSG